MTPVNYDRANTTAMRLHAPFFCEKATTQAARINVPFTVETAEGKLHCEDGWIAWDQDGNPYPISAEQFEQLYVTVAT